MHQFVNYVLSYLNFDYPVSLRLLLFIYELITRCAQRLTKYGVTHYRPKQVLYLCFGWAGTVETFYVSFSGEASARALAFAWTIKPAQVVSGSDPAKPIFLSRFHHEANAKDSQMRHSFCKNLRAHCNCASSLGSF